MSIAIDAEIEVRRRGRPKTCHCSNPNCPDPVFALPAFWSDWNDALGQLEFCSPACRTSYWLKFVKPQIQEREQCSHCGGSGYEPENLK